MYTFENALCTHSHTHIRTCGVRQAHFSTWHDVQTFFFHKSTDSHSVLSERVTIMYFAACSIDELIKLINYRRKKNSSDSNLT